MKLVKLIGLLSAAACITAIASEKVNTPFGIVSVNSTNELMLNGKLMQPSIVGGTSLSIEGAYALNDKHAVLLVSDSGGNACPAQYSWVVFGVNYIATTEEFGNCSDLAKTAKQGDRLVVSFPSYGTAKKATYVFDGKTLIENGGKTTGLTNIALESYANKASQSSLSKQAAPQNVAVPQTNNEPLVIITNSAGIQINACAEAYGLRRGLFEIAHASKPHREQLETIMGGIPLKEQEKSADLTADQYVLVGLISAKLREAKRGIGPVILAELSSASKSGRGVIYSDKLWNDLEKYQDICNRGFKRVSGIK